MNEDIKGRKWTRRWNKYCNRYLTVEINGMKISVPLLIEKIFDKRSLPKINKTSDERFCIKKPKEKNKLEDGYLVDYYDRCLQLKKDSVEEPKKLICTYSTWKESCWKWCNWKRSLKWHWKWCWMWWKWCN